jgi:hypothetical protein
VTGELVLAGEKIAIDCLSMRDRSWGTRRDDNRDMNIGYFHATATDKDAFLVVSNHATAVDGQSNDAEAPIVMGYLIKDGEYQALAQGTVSFQRNAGGRPLSTEIRGNDVTGRPPAQAVRCSSLCVAPVPGHPFRRRAGSSTASRASASCRTRCI